ncbi:CcmD family protein [Desulfolithobacter sp.]
MNNEAFLIATYVIIWGGLFGYLLYVNSQQDKLARKVASLEEMVRRREVGDE